MAYVVTFRPVDPLFAIDVSNAAAPELLGSLHIPGFSEYIHPLDATHLLTIGRNGTESGETAGAALQIFDVTNPMSPALTHKLDIGDGYSEAEYSHKAFTFYDGMLAIPMERYDYDSTNPFMSSTLEIFRIDAQEGITPVGSVDHTPLYQDIPQDYCYWYGYGVRRGVFIEDLVYSISEAGVIASEAANPQNTLASVKLPTEGTHDCYYGE